MISKKNIIIYLSWIFLILISLFFDKSVTDFFSGLQHGALTTFFEIISFFGNFFIVLIFSTILFFYDKKKREWIVPLWATFFITFAVVFLLKIIIGRERPSYEVLYPLFNIASASFPSLHTAAAFSIMCLLDREFPKFVFVWTLFAILVAVSRIYLNAHYLSDVIAGALLGFVIGHAVIYLEEKYRFFRKWTTKN